VDDNVFSSVRIPLYQRGVDNLFSKHSKPTEPSAAVDVVEHRK